MNIVLNKINQILMEKYLKLQDTCRTQVRTEPPETQQRVVLSRGERRGTRADSSASAHLTCNAIGLAGSQGQRPFSSPVFPSFPQLVWLVRELVKSGVLGADGVCMTFMKQIAGEFGGRSTERKERHPETTPRSWGVPGARGPPFLGHGVSPP